MHSHLSIHHLIRHVEERRNREINPVAVPEPITRLIHSVCDLFEPFSGVARAGYECSFAEESWEVSVFLGETECVGGPCDGELRPVNFRFDVGSVSGLFDAVHSLTWNALPRDYTSGDGMRFESFLTVLGEYEKLRISLQIHALAPQTFGPAMREHLDGRVELV